MSMNAFARISAYNSTAITEGLKIVRKVVASNPYPAGFTTAELFKLVAKEPPAPNFKALEIPRPQVSYSKTGTKRTPAPSPPRPRHPIKSMTFLKRSVLPILEGNKELKMVQTTRIPFNPASAPASAGKQHKGKHESHSASVAAPAPVTVWVWKPVDRSKLLPPAPKPQRKIFGVEVGVGEDWSHLSKRRKRARFGKVRRDVSVMKAVQASNIQKAQAEGEITLSLPLTENTATGADVTGTLRKQVVEVAANDFTQRVSQAAP